MPESVGKFSAKNGEAKVDVALSPATTLGLSKEEVMKFSVDPFWVAVRKALIVLFWTLWIAMLIGAVFIIIVTPKCQKGHESPWFEKSPIYTIRVDMFADSDGDGTGDLGGIIEKLDYIKNNISMAAVALEGLLEANDFTAIQPELGSEVDFKQLASQIKVVLKIPLVPEVEIDKALRKWAEAGAAGFILEDFNNLNSLHSDALPGWRMTTANATPSTDPMLLALSSSQFDALREDNCKYADMILNYEMINLPQAFMSTELDRVLAEVSASNASCRANFVLGAANVTPLVTRFEPRSLAETLILFALLSDATPIVYQGDEYGKRDTSDESKFRELRRMKDPHTGMMDWDDLQRRSSDKAPNIYKVFAAAAELRKNAPAISQGSVALRESNSVASMARVKTGFPGFVVVSNFATAKRTVNLLTSLSKRIPESGSIILTSTNSKHTKDKTVMLNTLDIEAGETIVVQFVPEPETETH